MKAEFVTFICTIFIGQKPVIRVRMIAPCEPGLKATFHTETLNSEVPCVDRLCALQGIQKDKSVNSHKVIHTWPCCAYTFQDFLQVTDIFLSLSAYFSPRGPEAELAKQTELTWVSSPSRIWRTHPCQVRASEVSEGDIWFTWRSQITGYCQHVSALHTFFSSGS